MNLFISNSHNNNQSIMARSSEENDDIRFDTGFSRIEELIKGNTFSSEEISYLMEILNSRVDNEQEKQKSNINLGGNTELVSLKQEEIPRTPAVQTQQNIDRTMIDACHEESIVPAGVGASPIDIARAYMAGRKSEEGHDLYSSLTKRNRTQPSNEFARTPLFPAPSPKPSICWPGSTVHDCLGYATPQSQRARQRLHEFPRTPYSRTILSKSTTKSQVDRGYANTSTPYQQSQTPIYGKANLRGDTVDGYASVGPIRRIRNKFTSEVRPRGSIFLNSPKDVPSKLVKPNVFGGYLGTEKNLEPGEASGSSKYWSGDNVSGSSDKDSPNSNTNPNPNPNSSSSQAVRKILEHLNSNKPTPKEKEAEMNLATAWRKSSPSETSVTIHEEKKADFQKNTDKAGPSSAVKFTEGAIKSKFLVNFNDKGSDEAKDVVNGNAKTSTAVFAGSRMIHGSNAVPSFGIKGTSGPAVKNLQENASVTTNHGLNGTSLNFSRPPLNNGKDVPSTRNQGSKHSLPSISISKPDFRAAVSKDNGPTFTFPFSASSGVLSEPPTPSITPTSPAKIMSQPAVGTPTVAPSYSFGINNSTPPLVFSFPSTSNASTNNDDTDIQFSFGSDKKARVSFSSLGKDGICY